MDAPDLPPGESIWPAKTEHFQWFVEISFHNPESDRMRRQFVPWAFHVEAVGIGTVPSRVTALMAFSRS